ncbi:hypothetical protein RF11_08731 [Thelohanellus kitauei]|uniref:Uncharacterized protein n=1 Tax=Thelohanellus kitauei TaxID=669202 RepID=A0A0C2MFW8_THEKT|nr:hypothetical protein RF11_08731 [Thelohanellus kitauei]
MSTIDHVLGLLILSFVIINEVKEVDSLPSTLIETLRPKGGDCENQIYQIGWKYLIEPQTLNIVKVEVRNQNTTIEIAELMSSFDGATLKKSENALSSIIKDFSKNKLVLHKVPAHLDGFEIHICIIYRQGDTDLKKYCVKYGTFVKESIGQDKSVSLEQKFKKVTNNSIDMFMVLVGGFVLIVALSVGGIMYKFTLHRIYHWK